MSETASALRATSDALIHDLRVYGRALSAEDVERLVGAGRAGYLVSKPADQRGAAEVDELFAWWIEAHDQPTKDLRSKLAGLEQEQSQIKARGTIAHVMNERPEPPMAHILFRGSPVPADAGQNLDALRVYQGGPLALRTC